MQHFCVDAGVILTFMEKLKRRIAYLPDGQKVLIEYVTTSWSKRSRSSPETQHHLPKVDRQSEVAGRAQYAEPSTLPRQDFPAASREPGAALRASKGQSESTCYLPTGTEINLPEFNLRQRDLPPEAEPLRFQTLFGTGAY
jgi:hypothetical protein